MIGSIVSIFYFALMWAAVAGEPQRAKHLSLTVSASEAQVRPGGKVTLAVDLVLDDNVHLYAPGAEGYLPVTWLAPESKLWKAGPVKLPAAKMLKMEAIGETAPVFGGTLHMSREVTLGNGAAGDVGIEGTVRYQACDERLCYRPDTVPVKWVVRVVK